MSVEPLVVIGFFDFGSGIHWLIILFVALLLFGKRLPEVMKNLGGSIREFKKGMDEGPKQDFSPPAPPQVPTPHIDGAVSRPAEPPIPPVDQAHDVPPSTTASEPSQTDSHHLPPTDPPQHH